MTSERAKARRVLIEAVEKEVLSVLAARGFATLKLPKEPTPMWHLSRRRSDGGYDAISIIFDEKRRPEFEAIINVIEAEGVHQPLGEFVAAEEATATALLKRILVRKRRRGVLATLLPALFGHGWFGFKPANTPKANRLAASQACTEFVAVLEQAERWWATRELGPELLLSDLSVPIKETNTK